MVHLKSTAEIEKMAVAGRIVADVLAAISEQARPGVSTAALDQTARDIMSRAGGKPSFLGYGQPPFPAAICTSIDCEVVHGIPSPKRILEDGNILSVDVGVNLDGYHADAARTFCIGTVHDSVKELVQTAKDCFWMAYAKAVVGNRIGELSVTIQTHAESHGYGVVRELTGHGIGRNLHEEPDIPNFGRRGHGLRLEAGMVLAVEPMINLGTRRVLLQDDGWTIVTADGKPSAHYENTFAVTENGPLVLTALVGEITDVPG